MKRKSNDCPADQHGPVYAVSGVGLTSHRKAARDGLSALARDARQAYGAAVEAAVITMQRRELIREACEPEARPSCASGSWDEYSAEAIRRQQAAALLAWPARERAQRSAQAWETLYVEARPRGFVPSWDRPETMQEAA
jgi:hypothetical protein